MPDFASVLTEKNAPEWAGLSGMIAAGKTPQALLAIAGGETAAALKEAYARLVLCDSGTGTDGCPSCSSWSEGGHPDMLTAGDGEGPPGIADCVQLQAALGLRPFVAKRRLGVIMFADALSPPAANSLLKTAEEPPEGAALMFLAEEDNLIPTIRSRVWTVRFSEDSGEAASPAPKTAEEWAEWIGRTRKKTSAELAPEVYGWTACLAESGRWREAAAVRNMMYISLKRHMPVSMIQDALYVFLEEGVSFEQIFGDLR
jgi:DNA polymerase-3 subunit delta'